MYTYLPNQTKQKTCHRTVIAHDGKVSTSRPASPESSSAKSTDAPPAARPAEQLAFRYIFGWHPEYPQMHDLAGFPNRDLGCSNCHVSRRRTGLESGVAWQIQLQTSPAGRHIRAEKTASSRLLANCSSNWASLKSLVTCAWTSLRK